MPVGTPLVENTAAFFDYIDGRAYLLAQDGQYLGDVSSNPFAANSIMNEFRSYGSAFSSTSIFNEFGLYGSPFGVFSAYNPFTSTPPYIVFQGANGDEIIAQ